MVYAACDMWGCLPIIVNRTTTTTTTTTTSPPITTQESWGKVTSTNVNSVNENKLVEKSDILIYVIITLTLIIVLTVIISAVWYSRSQKKKRSEKTKLIQVLILRAQQSALSDTSTTRGERSAVNDHPERTSQIQGEQWPTP